MVHVCGSFVPEMLKYVDYINFDVWNKGDLVVSHEQKIKEFMDRGGKIVAGIVPTNLSDLQTYFGERGQEIKDLNTVTSNPMVKWALLEECTRRVGNLISRLLPSIDFKTILDHLVISPQCGLGGLVPYDRSQAVEYTKMVYEITQVVAKEMGNLQKFA